KSARVQRYGGAESSGAAGGCERAGARRTKASQLGAEANRQRVAVRFLKVIQDILVIGLAVLVLNRGIDVCEDAQITKSLLRVHLPDGRERIARPERHVFLHQAAARNVQSRGDDFAYELPVAFVDHVGDGGAMRRGTLMPAGLQRRVRKTELVV